MNTMDLNNPNERYYALFVSQHLYFIPQFYPVAKELKKREKKILFMLMAKDLPNQNKIAEDFCDTNGFAYKVFNPDDEAIECTYMINGGNGFPGFKINYQYSVSIVHGIGTKAGYYSETLNSHDIRFIEGQKRVDKIMELFPDTNCNLYNVGFAKLDTAVNLTDEDKENLVKRLNLDPQKKTILYAPTFYPSSIENMDKSFPAHFEGYNVIVKPHFFSLQRKKYKHHLKKFAHWDTYTNVYFAGSKDFDLNPFMAVADIMVSDESSAIFEFAALNKPVVINRNVKYRLSYRLFKSKIRKRLDPNMDQYRQVGTYVYKYAELKDVVVDELKHPERKELERKEICDKIVGRVDGKVSERIAGILEEFKLKTSS